MLIKKEMNNLNEMNKYSDQELPHIQNDYGKIKKSLSSNIQTTQNLLNDLERNHSNKVEVK